MKVTEPGHCYELDHFEESEYAEVVQFIHKEQNEDGDLVTIQDGTTNEEVLRMMIDRIEFLQNKMPCEENIRAKGYLYKALGALESRTRDRKERGVEGTHNP